MSYDLMVFDPAEAPHDRAAFLEWYKQTTEWSEGHSYDDPNNTTLGLRNWFDDIRRTYPPMNGPLATDDYDNLKVTDYSIGHHAIYATFAWSKAEEAYPVVRELAVKHAVGFTTSAATRVTEKSISPATSCGRLRVALGEQ